MAANVTMPIDDPERVTIFGDWHGNTAWAIHALTAAKDRGINVALHVGDFGIWPGRRGSAYTLDVAATLAELDMHLFFIDGNHEDFTQLLGTPTDEETGLVKLRERLYYLPRGSRWTWHGREWLALGGATSVDREWRTPYVDWWPQESLTVNDCMRAVEGGRADYMLTHDTPAGYDVPGIPPPGTFPIRAIVEAEEHRDLLQVVVDDIRPTWLYHGHFHSRYSHQLPGFSGEDYCFIEGLDKDGSPGSDNWIDVYLD
jgi:hypothetical protein